MTMMLALFFISAAVASLETADSFAFMNAWNLAGLVSDNWAVSSRLTLAILARGNVNLNVLMRNLNTRAWLGLVFLAFAMGLVLFVPAAAVQYWQAWIYLAVFFGASGLITLYLMRKDPALLERRLRGGPTAEKKKTQKTIMLFVSIGFIALLVVPALDYRFGWSHIPLYIVIVGDLLTVLGFYITFLVYKANTFAFATIQVTADQKVVSTGPYAIVRHPMYAGGSLYLLGTPLALGSYWGLLVFAAMMPFLIWRLFDEERFLAKNLPGYTEYCARVRWRLVPGVF